MVNRKIEDIRTKYNLTITGFCYKVGISDVAYYKAQRRGRFGMETNEKISKAFNMPLSELIDENEKKHKITVVNEPKATYKVATTTIQVRIKELIYQLRKSQLDFAKDIGMSKQTITNVINSKNAKPGFDFIAGIAKAYPHVNVRWLLLGEGEMIIDIKSNLSIVAEPPTSYGHCQHCTDKDDTIAILKRYVASLENKGGKNQSKAS